LRQSRCSRDTCAESAVKPAARYPDRTRIYPEPEKYKLGKNERILSVAFAWWMARIRQYGLLDSIICVFDEFETHSCGA
jgi:hypothetical protein